MKKIIIVGGGLAGLVTSIKLIEAGIQCLVIEKKNYPFHRVCGEYISNEALPFLKSLRIFPEQMRPPQIKTLTLTSIKGKQVSMPLDLGGFGISRYAYDYFLYQEAVARGVEFKLNTEVDQIDFKENRFIIHTTSEVYEADVVVGAQGKRSKLDLTMKRSFTQKRSPFVGVKYHVRTDHPGDLIALHNFPGGYCGISNIEESKSNLCYLTHRDQVKKYKSLSQFQEAIVFQNPHLRRIFGNSEFLFKSPETINEITFDTKNSIENHVLMAGDAAGMITPLCGNGMAMAIHSAKILSELIIRFRNEANFNRPLLEETYRSLWKKNFAVRLWKGRQVQRLFGQHWASEFAVALVKYSDPIARQIVKNTHGPVF